MAVAAPYTTTVTGVCQISLSLINTQSSATANPHVQSIVIPHSTITQYCPFASGIPSTSLVLYARFYDQVTGQFIPSWYEAFDGSNHHWWVRLGTGIGAGATYPLQLIVYSGPVIDGNLVGVNPYYAQNTLGLAYGQYDNGQNIFYAYWNWTGTSWPSGWSYTYASPNYIWVNNGLNIYASTPPGSGDVVWAWYSITSIVSQLANYGIAIRTLVLTYINTASGCGGDEDWFLGYGVSLSTAPEYAYGYRVINLFCCGNSASTIYRDSSSGGSTVVSVADSTGRNNLFIAYGVWYGSNLAWWRYSYPSYTLQKSLSASDTVYSLSQVQQFAIFTWGVCNGVLYFVQFFDALFDVPPNNVMPAVTAVAGLYTTYSVIPQPLPPLMPYLPSNMLVTAPSGFVSAGPNLIASPNGWYFPQCSVTTNVYGGATGTYGLPACIAISNGAVTFVAWAYVPPGGQGVLLSLSQVTYPTSQVSMIPLGINSVGTMYMSDVVPSPYSAIPYQVISGWHLFVLEAYVTNNVFYYDYYVDNAYLVGRVILNSTPAMFGGGGPYPYVYLGVGYSPYTNSWQSFNGIIAYVALYNRVLSTNEISALYTGTRIVNGLVAEYIGNNYVPTTGVWYDTSGNNYHLTTTITTTYPPRGCVLWPWPSGTAGTWQNWPQC